MTSMQNRKWTQRLIKPARKLLARPILAFIQLEASSGLLLLSSALIAMLWANSPWSSQYFSLWHAEVGIGVGEFTLTKSLQHWVNDGLMAVFFLVVGLEIKREILLGELSSIRQAVLPIVAAIGGMVGPALLYVAFTTGSEAARGWGIPMATDIAFALGVIALAGKGVPLSLKIFLTALAIVDDMGAVIAIALFYTADISTLALGGAALLLVVLFAMNVIGLKRLWPYLLLGLVLWFAVLKSGVHASIAGVLLAATIPIGLQGRWKSQREREALDLQAISPLHRLEHLLHPYVTYGVMPVFALANAGLNLQGTLAPAIASPVSWGIIVGLLAGKQIGIMLLSWLAVKLGLASLPPGLTWKHIYSVTWLAGIGFTMSLFIAGLAFGEGELMTASKIGIFTASLVAGIVGWLLVRSLGRREDAASPASHSPVKS